MASNMKSQARSYLPLLAAIVLLGISAYVRFALRAVVTTDLDFHILQWYTKLQRLGPLNGLGRDFYNYTPAYVYLLALATLTSGFISAVSAVKFISIAFDVYCAFVIYRIVRLEYKQGFLPHLAAAIFLAAPTIIANSSAWGQADSTVTAFLLTCVYFLLVEKPLAAILFFSIGFAFKPQAIFLAPLLLILLLRKKIPWYYFILVPLVYVLSVWPVVVLGRSWMDVLTIYSSQAGSGKALTHNAPSLYIFVPKSATSWLFGPAVIIGNLVTLIWAVYAWLSTLRIDRHSILLLALISVTLPPFVLPNMHDRYFYVSDALSIPVAFTTPELWFLPILFQVSSGLAYSVYLLSAPPTNVAVAGFINLFILVYLFRRQWHINRPEAPKAESSQRLAGLTDS